MNRRCRLPFRVVSGPAPIKTRRDTRHTLPFLPGTWLHSAGARIVITQDGEYLTIRNPKLGERRILLSDFEHGHHIRYFGHCCALLGGQPWARCIQCRSGGGHGLEAPVDATECNFDVQSRPGPAVLSLHNLRGLALLGAAREHGNSLEPMWPLCVRIHTATCEFVGRLARGILASSRQ